MDYVKIAREIVYHTEQERGTGRTFILNYGVHLSDRKPIIVGFSRQHANEEVSNHIECGHMKCISLKDIENGELNGTKGPTILTHIVQEELLKQLLKRITELEEINQDLILENVQPLL